MAQLRGSAWFPWVVTGWLAIACAPTPESAERLPPGLPWPHELSDLPPDPALQFGRLPNGFRYAWQAPAKPGPRCSLRLVVHVGSLDETAAEQGMAHFVEHMAFHGTPKLSRAELMRWYQGQGMRPGADLNAHTYDRCTTYEVDLPSSTTAVVREALEVLCEFTTGMQCLPASVEAEKLVIDAEERERSSPKVRVREEQMSRLLAGSRVATSSPIGVAEQRARFTAAELKTFHALWYRPDNMTIVLVGDLDTEQVKGLVGATFGALPTPASPVPRRPHEGTPHFTERRIAIEVADSTEAEFLVLCPRAPTPGPDTVASLRRRIELEAAAEMARWTLDALRGQVDSPVTAVDVAPWDGPGLGSAETVALYFRCRSDRAEDAVSLLGSRLAGLLHREFSEDLVDRVRAAKVAELQAWVATVTAAGADKLAHHVAMKLADGQVPTNAAQLAACLEQEWRQVSAQSCSRTFRAAWECSDPVLLSIAPGPLAFDPKTTWRGASQLWDESEAEEVANATRTIDWPYTIPSTTPAASPTAATLVAPLDVHDVRFANGVRLLLKPTQLAADQILISVGIGDGPGALPDDLRPAARALELVVTHSGLGKLSPTDLREITATRRATMVAGSPRRFELRGVTNRQSLGFQIELLMAQCTDPGWSEQVLQQELARYAPRAKQAQRSSMGALPRFWGELVDRQLEPLPGEVAAVSLAEVQRCFAATWGEARLTIVVVGDVDVGETIETVSRTFGSLGPRRAAMEHGSGPPRAIRRGVHQERTIEASEDSSAVNVFAPLTEADVSTDLLAVGCLSRVLADRLYAQIRDQLGASYGIAVNFYELPTDGERFLLWVNLRTAAGSERDVRAAALKVLEDLRTQGVTESELAAVRAAMQNQWTKDLSTNQGWLESLSGVHADDDALARLRTRMDGLRQLSLAEVNRAAARCLLPESLSSIVLQSPR